MFFTSLGPQIYGVVKRYNFILRHTELQNDNKFTNRLSFISKESLWVIVYWTFTNASCS